MLAQIVPLARIELNATSSFLTSSFISELLQQPRTHCVDAAVLFEAAMEEANCDDQIPDMANTKRVGLARGTVFPREYVPSIKILYYTHLHTPFYLYFISCAS